MGCGVEKTPPHPIYKKDYMRKCIEEGCDREHQAKGYCQKHYQYNKAHGVFGGDECPIENCSNVIIKTGYCKPHYDILVKYKLSKEEYYSLIEKANGSCQICGLIPKQLHVDHDHETGRVRGLLCRKCNTGLGKFGDSETLLYKAIEYLN